MGSVVKLVCPDTRDLCHSADARLEGVYDLHPPTHVCIDPQCSKQVRGNSSAFHDRELVEPSTYSITLFTKELGPVPGFSTSRYCRRKLFSVARLNMLS